MATEQPWIEWSGGDCPVSLLARVDVKFRDGIEALNTFAKGWCGPENALNDPQASCWQHDPAAPYSDITAYRVVSS
jgi:hypothetical protein